MTRLCCLLLFLGSLSRVAVAADDPALPGPPPQFAIVTQVNAEKEEVVVRYTVSKPVFETFSYTVTVDGKEEERTATRQKMVYETREQVFKLSEVRVVTAAKESLKTADAIKRLEPDSAVVLHNGGTKFDSRYLNALREETLVIVTKAITTVDAPMPPAPVIDAVPLPPAPPAP